MPHKLTRSLLAILFAMFAASVSAQKLPNPYGLPVSVENAKKAAAAAIAEARKNNWSMVVAVVDPNGDLIYYEKMDNTQLGSSQVAINKARSAARFKRPTKSFEDTLQSGGLRLLAVEGAVAVAGGVPIVMEGKIVGAIGVSGETSDNDNQCATAGSVALK